MSPTPRPLSILVMDPERSRHPAIQALASHGRLIVTDPPDDLRALTIADTPDVVIVDAFGKSHPIEQRVGVLRRHPSLASVPIVVTGVSVTEPSLVVRLFEAGADDCLTDPLSPEILIARVRRLLMRRQLPQSDAIGRLAGGVAHNFNNSRRIPVPGCMRGSRTRLRCVLRS